MRLFRPFKRASANAGNLKIEPRVRRDLSRQAEEDARTTLPELLWLAAEGEKPYLRSNNAIYDLLGAGKASPLTPEPADVAGADQLIGSLYEQYCQALVSPDIELQNYGWVEDDVHKKYGPASPESLAEKDTDESGNMTHLFQRERTLEQAFGPLLDSERLGGVLPARMPDILQVFAPPELQAAIASRPVQFSELARREHHAMSIDSPVSAVVGVSHEP